MKSTSNLSVRKLLIPSCMGIFLIMSPAFGRSSKTRHSAEHDAAVKKCSADYSAARASATNLKGKERKYALRIAKVDRKKCLANAPKP
jgi:hypothetical protein